MVAILRDWFLELGVIEVLTPILVNYPSSEPTITNLKIQSHDKYLRTSSEFALKKILIEKNIDVFEIGHVFRGNESGPSHLTEFRMLEWYRNEKTHRDLIEEITDLLERIGFNCNILTLSYQTIFKNKFDVSPHEASVFQLRDLVAKNISIDPKVLIDRTELFDCLNMVLMDTEIFKNNAIFVYDFPVELRGYSELCADIRYAKRFELYIKGLEIANGYQEIIDPEEQKQCFLAENQLRRRRGTPTVPINEEFLQVMRNNNRRKYSGAALGVERLLAALHKVEELSKLNLY